MEACLYFPLCITPLNMFSPTHIFFSCRHIRCNFLRLHKHRADWLGDIKNACNPPPLETSSSFSRHVQECCVMLDTALSYGGGRCLVAEKKRRAETMSTSCFRQYLQSDNGRKWIRITTEEALEELKEQRSESQVLTPSSL